MAASTLQSPAFFEALERRRTNALVQRDVATIELLHAPEYELVTPSGVTFSRARYLAAISREPFYSSWLCEDMRVRVSSEMAALRYVATLGFPTGRNVRVWHTDIYQCMSGQWQAVWSQATELPPSNPNPGAA